MRIYTAAFVIAISLCFCTANVGCGSARNISKSAQSTSIAVTPQNLTFGTVKVGASAKKTVTITNNGKSTVTLTQVTAGSSVFRVSGLTLPLSLKPSQSHKFDVVFTPTSAVETTTNMALTQTSSGLSSVLGLQGLGS